MSRKRILLAANVLAFVFTIFINYLSNTGAINGNTVARVSAQNQNLFTPAGYAFSIWGLIYLGLLLFVIYLTIRRRRKNEKFEVLMRVGNLFVLSCMLNCLWLFAWLYELIGLSVLIMIALLFCLFRIIIKLNINQHAVSETRLICVFWPFAIYSGWISVALIANISAWLTHIRWNGWGLPVVGWAILMVGVAGAINVYVTWKRNLKLFSLVGIWALIAIAVNNWASFPVVSITAITVSIILVASIIGHMIVRS